MSLSRLRSSLRGGAVVFLALVCALARSAEAAMPPGVVIESVAKPGAAESAGAAEGDLLLSWECGAAQGALASPLDLITLERTYATSCPMRFSGRRGDAPITLEITAHNWQLLARPLFEGDVLAAYARGRDALASGDAAEGDRLWRELATSFERSGDTRTACWLLFRLGQTHARPRRAWPESAAAFEAAVPLAREPGDLVLVHLYRGWAYEGQGRFDAQTEAQELALELQRGLSAESLLFAHILNELGNAAFNRLDLVHAEQRYRDAYDLRQRQVPGGWLAAVSLTNLGNARGEMGDNAGAQAAYETALSIFERLQPDSTTVADCLTNLAIETRRRGDFDGAEQLLRRALSLREKAGAEVDFALGNTLLGLGNVWHELGDDERRQHFFERARAVFERVRPGGRGHSIALNALGVAAMQRRDLAGAERFHREALSLAEARQADLDIGQVLNNLALVKRLRGDLDEARELGRRALDRVAGAVPDNLEHATVLENYGEIEFARGELDGAESAFRKSAEIRRRLAPGSRWEATSLALMGRVAARRGDHARAAALYGEALDVLDRQSSRVTPSQEALLAFGAGFGGLYREAIDVLLQAGKTAEAFHVLERSRARAFLALLDHRDILDADVPADLDRRRRRIDADYDRAQAQLARLDPAKSAGEVERLTARLRELRLEQDEIRAELRRVSPRFAALRSPESLDAAGAAAALDAGTALLSYVVADDHTDLFVITKDEPLPRRFRLAPGREALERRVAAFRERIARPLPAERIALDREASALYDALVRPAEEAIGAAQRIVVCPDGVLRTLPFAALRRNGRYLVEWRPLHSTVSATVYAALQRERVAAAASGTLVAFGDPRYPAAPAPSARERSEARRGLHLAALPASRHEVESIAALFGRDSRVFLGAAATEERAKAESPRSRYLHFACHGFVDPVLPLNSGLALTVRDAPNEGQDNGLLQAWEVFERVRLDAELVTLSACDSGLGKDMGGEGLVGLTRAFQYAGARTVLASLWAVSDRSTGELMRRFYQGLRKGLTKDEALRRAQIALIDGPAARSHPFRWAGFQIFGDWK